MRSDPSEPPFPGVRALDHTADVGLEIEAPGLAELVARAALGLTWLLFDRAATGPEVVRALEVGAATPEALLREVLRELLWWHEADGLSAVELNDVRIAEGEGGLSLEATARLAADPAAPLREIKGVTLHGLVAEPRGADWHGRVIFDV
jgi:SHS2 domain-containing protein